MKYLILLYCILLFSTSTLSQASKAKLEIQTGGEFDFGTFHNVDSITHTFVLKNVGSDTLKISEVQKGCDCTSSHLESNNISPGKETKLGNVHIFV